MKGYGPRWQAKKLSHTTLADRMVAAVALCDDASIATADVADFQQFAAGGLRVP